MKRGESLTPKPWKVVRDGEKPRTFVDRVEAHEYANEHGGKVVSNSMASRKPPKFAQRKVARPAFPKEVAAAIRARSGGYCEVRLDGCSGKATGRHHRMLVTQGGPDTEENCVHVCRECHTAGPKAIHRNVKWARAVGLIVPSWDGPPTDAWTRT